MNSIAKVLFTVTSFAPSALLVGLATYWSEGLSFNAMAWLLVTVGLLALAFSVLRFATVNVASTILKLKKFQTEDRHFLKSIFVGVSPFAVCEFAKFQPTLQQNWALAIVPIVLFAVVYYRSKSFYYNPLLLVGGYNAYSITTDNETVYLLITRRHLKNPGEIIECVNLYDYAYMETPSR